MQTPVKRRGAMWIPATEALAQLQVRAQTLYANVSRGKIRAQPDPSDPRKSRYHAGDVQRLARGKAGRRQVAQVASGAIAWGEPVLPTALSTVLDGRLLYRGQDAVALAEHASLEDVAALLWGGEPPRLNPSTSGEARTPARSQDPLSRAMMALAERANTDLPSLHRSLPALRQEAAQVLQATLNALLTSSGDASAKRGSLRASNSLAARLARAWARQGAEDLLRRALVLLADHELNASTFATRVAISTGASLSAGVLAGLATLSGPLHGKAAASALSLVSSAQQLGAESAVRQALTQGERLLAFGHPLYPDGDPRAAALLAALQAQARLPPLFAELARWGEELAGERPNVDFALAALCTVLKLPGHAATTLFAAARCVGWLAHALEQAQAATGPIRPRARYEGGAGLGAGPRVLGAPSSAHA